MMIRSLKLIQMCNINIRNIVTQNGNICPGIKSHYVSVNKISLWTQGSSVFKDFLVSL